MKELEKTLKEIEIHREFAAEHGNFNVASAFELCTNIIRNHINNGWIPVEERLPKNSNYILLSFSNYSLPAIGRYEYNTAGGAFYVGDDDKTCVSRGLFVNAWQPLPEPYKA